MLAGMWWEGVDLKSIRLLTYRFLLQVLGILILMNKQQAGDEISTSCVLTLLKRGSNIQVEKL